MKKISYQAHNFIFHLFQKGDTISIGLASGRVYPNVSKDELKDLLEFISQFLEKTNHD